MIQFNLRLRITVAIGIVCLLIITILGVTLYISSEKMELALVDQLVTEELDFLAERYRVNPREVPQSGLNIQYYVASSADAVSALPEYLRDLGPGHHEVEIGVNSGERDIAVRLSGNTRYYVVYDIGPYEDREREYKQLVFLSVIVIAIVALVAGYYLAGFLSRQLSQLANDVKTLNPDKLSRPLSKEGQDKEVSMLAEALDHYQARILDLIQREQEFTANVSHELRTPLTEIRTSCELLANETGLSAKTRERLDNINSATEKMTQSIGILLFLAREKEFGNKEPVDVLECAEEVLASIHDDACRKGLKIEVDIAAGTILETNRQALQLVLKNLVANAVRYTEQGYVRISYSAGKLQVSDSGPGIVSEKITHIFTRNYRGEEGSEGLGLGLNIVKRICDLTGWNIQVDSIPAAGSRFILTLS